MATTASSAASTTTNSNDNNANSNIENTMAVDENDVFQLPNDENWIKVVTLQWLAIAPSIALGAGSSAAVKKEFGKKENTLQLRRENGEVTMMHCSD